MNPVIVALAKIIEKKIILISEDLIVKAEFSEIHKLQETGNPY